MVLVLAMIGGLVILANGVHRRGRGDRTQGLLLIACGAVIATGAALAIVNWSPLFD